MNKNVTAAEQAEQLVPPRRTPEVDPARVQFDHIGTLIRHIVVRLPVGWQASDLAEPTAWRRVMAHPGKALRKLDKLILIGHDEGHLWEAWVSQVTPTSAVLARPSHYELQSRHGTYFSDDRYKVQWDGASFEVIRREDSHVMSRGHSSEQLAIRALQMLYPQKVA